MRKITPVGKGSFARKVLRALGKDSGFEFPQTSEEKKPFGVSAYHANHDFYKELTNAMLEAEKSKAEAIMGCQRCNLLY